MSVYCWGVTCDLRQLPLQCMHNKSIRPAPHTSAPLPRCPRRSCRVLEQSPEGAEAADALGECSTLVELLEARQAALAATLEGAFPELRATVWQSEASVQAAVQVRLHCSAHLQLLCCLA